VRRHPSLVPLSHDHHHGLVQARRLRREAEGDAVARRAAAAAFLAFFSGETVRHFREEEETLFPLLVAGEDPPPDLLVQALLEHQRIHSLAARLDDALVAGEEPRDLLLELAGVLERHIRLEERRLFPLIEETVPEGLDRRVHDARRDDAAGPVVDLLAARGRGPVWGTESEDLNATVLSWNAGEGPPEHVNSERDVFLLVLAGSATLLLEGEEHAVHAGDAVLVEKGRSRRLTAGADGVRYLSVHRRRAPLGITQAGGGAG
jgi:quercetin dioxygenase-like cupin family protein